MTITSSIRTGSSVTETRRITVPDPKAAPRPKPRVTVGGVVRIVGLGLWLLITLFPLYWITLTAFKSPGTINRFPIEYWPSEPSLDNYTSLFEKSSFGTFLANSAIVAVSAGAVATLIALLSAYCIPFSTVMLRGFFENVPDALEEAAMIDGCSRLGALFRVLVPVMTPGIIAAFIFNFVNCWNELFLSVVLMNTDANRTVPSALNGFISTFNIDWGSMSAAAVLTILPTMVMFALASRWIVQGLTAGAVKE